jgi:hypothetical protein
MKIGIVLTGLVSILKNRDWKRTKDNIKENLIDCWSTHETKIYLNTNEITPEILEFYKPEKWTQTYLTLYLKYRTLKSIELVQEEDLDFIIFTRPDILFLDKVSLFNIDFNKFNFLFREINHFYDGRYFTCDNFYALPFKYLDPFRQAINNPENEAFSGHFHDQIYPGLKKIITEENIHFIQEEEGYSGPAQNKFYLLDRYNNIDGDLGPTSIEKLERLKIEDPNSVFLPKRD